MTIVLDLLLFLVNVLFQGAECMSQEMDSVDQLQMLHEALKLWVIMDKIEKHIDIPEVCFKRLFILHSEGGLLIFL